MLRRIALLAAALTLIAVPPAAADGDPASDVLPTEDAFYPYNPPPSKPLVDALDALLERVRKAGYPMKVALIGSASDLGAYPTMFNDPQRYTDLLAGELPTNPHGKIAKGLRLLVIMPGGFGGKNLGERVDEALAPVKIDVEAQTDGLVRAALAAVARIATVNGFETPVPPEASADEGEGGSTPLIIVGAVILVLLVALVAVRRRLRASDERPDDGLSAQDPSPDARIT